MGESLNGQGWAIVREGKGRLFKRKHLYKIITNKMVLKLLNGKKKHFNTGTTLLVN
jgi:hypothetical protein